MTAAFQPATGATHEHHVTVAFHSVDGVSHEHHVTVAYLPVAGTGHQHDHNLDLAVTFAIHCPMGDSTEIYGSYFLQRPKDRRLMIEEMKKRRHAAPS